MVNSHFTGNFKLPAACAALENYFDVFFWNLLERIKALDSFELALVFRAQHIFGKLSKVNFAVMVR